MKFHQFVFISSCLIIVVTASPLDTSDEYDGGYDLSEEDSNEIVSIEETENMKRLEMDIIELKMDLGNLEIYGHTMETKNILKKKLEKLELKLEIEKLQSKLEKLEEIQLLTPSSDIINSISADNIRAHLRHLTLVPHLGGTEGEDEVAQYVYDNWVEQGMDEVHFVSYDTLLSYPSQDQNEPNVLTLTTLDNDQWFSRTKQKPLYAKEEFNEDLPFTFNGYSAPGNVTSSEVVYVNYGQESDYDYLEKEKNITVEGRLVIAKYGKVFRGNIVNSAEKRGAIGVILYSDPKDYAPQGTNNTYPNSIYLPEFAAPFGTTYLYDGDPLTPLFPSVESAYRIPEEEAPLPKIPVQPIDFEDAETILSFLSGEEVPEEWKGGLQIPYRFGPELKNASLNMEVHTHNQRSTTNNVIGMLRGKEEPDRYVVVGNHMDAWLLGGLDPSSGTATMLEMSQSILNYHKTTGWRPRRSILFCAWGSEEYGLIGSQEWIEQFGKQLSAKSVAYLNVDMSIEGNYTLRTKAAPLLYDIIWESAKRISNPDEMEVLAGRTKVYDTWVLRRPDDKRPGFPLMQFIGSGSDYKGFQHNLGVPCLDLRYTHDKTVLGQPLYHTLYETFESVDELFDRGFRFHRAIAQMWTDLAVILATEKILPFSLKEYSSFMENAESDIKSHYGDLLENNSISLDYFEAALNLFSMEVDNFIKYIGEVDDKNEMELRLINDRIMAVERSFIDPNGLPGRFNYNHVVFAPSMDDTYSGTAFSGLTDTLNAIEKATNEEDKNELLRIFKHHLAAVTHYINTATKALTGEVW